MAEYIERQGAISILNAKSDMALGTPKQCFAAAAAMLEKLPAADVVEVVRCKDCKYYDKGICYYPTVKYVAHDKEHYCSYGERRDGNEDCI